jgi:hypothetical protein
VRTAAVALVYHSCVAAGILAAAAFLGFLGVALVVAAALVLAAWLPIPRGP